VILGSGWAGFTVARTLDASKYQAVVVSPRSYFAFTPLLASTAVGTLEFRTALEPVRSRRTRVDFFQGWADDVDFKNKTITIEQAVDDPLQGLALTTDRHAGESREQREAERKKEVEKGRMFDLTYDKLIVSVGCYSQTFKTPGVREHAYFLKDVGDARKIRNRLLACFEGAALPTTSDEMRRQLLNFAVVGGGPTGIEFSAELHDLINEDMAKIYPELIKYHKITVYDVAEKVLPMFDEKLAGYAMQKFKREGIDIKTSHHVEELSTGAPAERSASEDANDYHLYTLKIKEEGEIGVGMCVWSTSPHLSLSTFHTNYLTRHRTHAKSLRRPRPRRRPRSPLQPPPPRIQRLRQRLLFHPLRAHHKMESQERPQIRLHHHRRPPPRQTHPPRLFFLPDHRSNPPRCLRPRRLRHHRIHYVPRHRTSCQPKSGLAI
jgi:NADH dehydrogenase FAD-containing subunit